MDRPYEGSKIHVHKVDEPNKGQNYTSPQVVGHHEGYTIKPIHKVDGHMFQQMRWPQDGPTIQHILRGMSLNEDGVYKHR